MRRDWVLMIVVVAILMMTGAAAGAAAWVILTDHPAAGYVPRYCGLVIR